MKTSLKFLAIALTCSIVGAANAQYQKQGVRLLKQFALNQFSGNPSSGAACNGYVSPSGREYAIMCLRNGNSVVEVTDPENAQIIGHVNGPVSLWHETYVMGDFAYAATEGGGGIQIIDLRNVDNGQVSLHSTYTGQGLSSIHTIQANPVSKRVYANGSNIGFAIIDFTNPTAGAYRGKWTNSYVHDSIIVTWTEGVHAGKEIAFICGAQNGLYILDVTNPSNIVQLARLFYVGDGYCHSASLSPDRKYLYVNDEFDELNNKVATASTWVIDIQNLTAPFVKSIFTNGLPVIDHNSWEQDGFLMLASYSAGMRVYDIRDVNNIKETGWFDTYPSGNPEDFVGNWGVFAGFPSRTVVASDMQRGLFIFDPSEAKGEGAPILNVNLEIGSLVNGGRKELRYADSNNYVATNAPGFSSEVKPTVQLAIRHETTYSPVTKLKVDWRASVSLTTGAKSELFLKNQSNSQWVKVGEGQLTHTQQTFTVDNISVGNFVKADGTIESRLKIQSQAPTAVSKMTAFVDMVRVTAIK